ncbi:hypothetical protein GCM10029964_102410 [Kibdelosporangium lantanae]
MSHQPWDRGLQVERTALAWLRTCLALVAVALVAFRFAAHHSLPLALVLFAGVLAFGLFAGVLAWRRYRTSDEHLTEDKPLPGGGLAGLMTAMTVLTGTLGLAYVLLGR